MNLSNRAYTKEEVEEINRMAEERMAINRAVAKAYMKMIAQLANGEVPPFLIDEDKPSDAPQPR